ncbi:MAG: porphobilinogen synthase [Elusimicrobia bacterium]|nr:porphobilinogen synthase [Elusimicrobiota bacterium]
MSFPATRLRRLRSSKPLRNLVQETDLKVTDLVAPLFVRPGREEKKPISSMPGQFQFSVDELVLEARRLKDLGVPAVILFGIPETKDAQASDAYEDGGIIQNAVRAVKEAVPDLALITDLCFCEYTDHGHCGIIKSSELGVESLELGTSKSRIITRNSQLATRNFVLDNDATLELIAKTAVSQAKAGADVIAPSGMMDGQVKTIRQALDRSGFESVPILSYSAKYASSFYGPFREAAESPPQFGDRTTYQMNPANRQEALREVALDVEEGADMVMVKPALAYLDVLREVKSQFGLPTAAYSVSGEYAMIKAAAQKGWIDEKRIALEVLLSIKRAGADFILTYYSGQAAEWLRRV